jgi:peptidyl-prolyl cis-trans isomerase B (cyclophilin B)
MSRQIASFRLSTSLVMLALAGGLSACGGGGGGGDDSPATPSALPPPPVAYQSVQLDSSTFVPVGTINGQADWDYGDGTQGTSASHTYSKPGIYTVTYSYTDGKGQAAKGSTKVEVQSCSNAGIAAAKASTATTNVCVQTNKGEMVFALDTAKAQATTTNFLKYVDAGFYSGTLFHRIIKGFMAQGGGFKPAADGMHQLSTLPPITLESNIGLQNKAYTLAMARGGDPEYNSATSQFFINFADHAFLDYRSATAPGYAVFGKVIAGQPVVDDLAKVTTANVPTFIADGTYVGNYPDVPVPAVVILGMSRIN